MKNYKTKFGIAYNILKNYDKFKEGYRVKIIKNNGLKKYDKLIGKIGIYEGIELKNKEKPFIVHFLDINEKYCFSKDELEKID